MDLYEGLITRRSIRKYADKKIPHDVLEEIIKAAQYAPSAHNKQSWEFLVIEDKETLASLRVIQRWTSFAKDASLHRANKKQRSLHIRIHSIIFSKHRQETGGGK